MVSALDFEDDEYYHFYIAIYILVFCIWQIISFIPWNFVRKKSSGIGKNSVGAAKITAFITEPLVINIAKLKLSFSVLWVSPSKQICIYICIYSLLYNKNITKSTHCRLCVAKESLVPSLSLSYPLCSLNLIKSHHMNDFRFNIYMIT